MKSYKEIQAENRRRKVVAGWQPGSQPVAGGHHPHRQSDMLTPAERCGVAATMSVTKKGKRR